MLDILKILKDELAKDSLKDEIKKLAQNQKNLQLKKIKYRQKKDVQKKINLDQTVYKEKSLTKNLKLLYNEKIASKYCEIDFKFINQIK